MDEDTLDLQKVCAEKMQESVIPPDMVKFTASNIEGNTTLVGRLSTAGFVIDSGFIMVPENYKKIFKKHINLINIYDQIIRTPPIRDNVYHIANPIRVGTPTDAACMVRGKPNTSAKIWKTNDKEPFDKWYARQELTSLCIVETKNIEFEAEMFDLENLVSQECYFRNIYNYKPFFNSKWTEKLAVKEMCIAYNIKHSDVIQNPEGGTTAKMDFTCPKLGIFFGDVKSGEVGLTVDGNLTWGNLGSITFNKINEEYGAKKPFLIDSLVFIGWNGEDGKVIYSLLVVGMENMQKLHGLMAKELADALAKQEIKRNEKKSIGRDGFIVKMKDIVTILDDSSMTILYKHQKISKADFARMLEEKYENQNEIKSS
jgi:hypothetical protein